MLNRNLEVEYKTLITKKQHDFLLDYFLGNYQIIEQTNVYYADTHNQLSNLKASLRIRTIANYSVMTLKIPTADGLQEYEIETDDINSSPVKELLSSFGVNAPIVEITSLKTIRKLVTLEQADLCIDENHYNGIVDYELEYECTKKHDGLSCFKDLLSKVNINYQENKQSKYLRAITSVLK